MGELIVNAVKWGFIISIALIFMTAITTLLDFLFELVPSNIIGEFFGLISCFLPFSASTVFSSIFTALSAILSFMVANKIFDLTAQRVSV